MIIGASLSSEENQFLFVTNATISYHCENNERSIEQKEGNRMNTKTTWEELRALVKINVPELSKLSSDEKASVMRSIEDLRFYSTTSDKDTKEIASIEIYHKETREDRENALVVIMSCSIVEPEVKILCGKREYAFEIGLMIRRQTPDEYNDERYYASPLSRDEVSAILFGDVLPL